MANLLKAMGFWIWGLLAIGLSISVLTVSHRLNIFARLPNAQSEALRELQLFGCSTPTRCQNLLPRILSDARPRIKPAPPNSPD
jgi:hypothetical protein